MTGLQFACHHRYPGGFELDATFTAGDGVTALFGPSGAGKSTVFGLIAGLRRPKSGKISLGNRVLLDTTTGVYLPPERRQVGVVFQDQLLFPHLSVRQNLLFGRRRSAGRIDFQRLVQLLEIGELLDRRPDTLSGGQQQRVALGRAILCEPQLLLMDEPLTGLDESLKDRILTYLERAVGEWRIPTLLVSHDQSDVRRLADQVVVLEAGRVIASGPTATTLDRAALARPSQHPDLVNLLRITNLRRVKDHWEGNVGEQLLHLPSAKSLCDGGTALVRFLPHDVALSREPILSVSIRNQLHGVVRELVPLADRSFVAIDVGQFLWAEVTNESVRELNVQAGQSITCLVKTAAIEILE